MNAPRRVPARVLGAAAAALAYAILAHLANSNPRVQPLGVALALAPLLFAVVIILWRGSWRISALLVTVLAAVTMVRYWAMLALHFPWLFLAQQAGCYALLGVMFGRSLRSGREPLCTLWATRVHGPLSPALVRYTRQVTVAWTLFFVLITLTHVLLFLLAPLPAWSAFANFVCLPLVAAMFVGEYLLRGQLLPGMRHARMLDGVRAFLGATRPDAMHRG